MLLRLTNSENNTIVSRSDQTYRVYTTKFPVEIKIMDWLIFNESDYSIGLVNTKYGKPEKRFNQKKDCRKTENINELLISAKIPDQYKDVFKDSINYIVSMVSAIKYAKKAEKKTKLAKSKKTAIKALN